MQKLSKTSPAAMELDSLLLLYMANMYELLQDMLEQKIPIIDIIGNDYMINKKKLKQRHLFESNFFLFGFYRVKGKPKSHLK